MYEKEVEQLVQAEHPGGVLEDTFAQQDPKSLEDDVFPFLNNNNIALLLFIYHKFGNQTIITLDVVLSPSLKCQKKGAKTHFDCISDLFHLIIISHLLKGAKWLSLCVTNYCH